MTVRLGGDVRLKLIRLVKEHQVVYDPKHPQHSDKVYVDYVWSEIASQVGLRGKQSRYVVVVVRAMPRTGWRAEGRKEAPRSRPATGHACRFCYSPSCSAVVSSLIPFQCFNEVFYHLIIIYIYIITYK